MVVISTELSISNAAQAVRPHHCQAVRGRHAA
jgi:hypothetical protein